MAFCPRCHKFCKSKLNAGSAGTPTSIHFKIGGKVNESSSAGEFHPHALTESNAASRLRGAYPHLLCSLAAHLPIKIKHVLLKCAVVEEETNKVAIKNIEL